MEKKLLMISTDRKIFEEGSAVRARQIGYAKEWGEVHIVIFSKTSNLKSKISNNCYIYSTNSRSKVLYSFDAIRLGRAIIEKYGVTNITCQDSSLTAMAGVSLKKRFGIPLEIQIHEDIGSPNYTFKWSNRIRKFLATKYIPQADTVRVVSERIRKYIEESRIKNHESRIEVRPIEVDINAINGAPIIPNADLHKKYPQFEKIVLMASRLEPEKNVKLAIDCWPKILEKIPKAGLIIVGNGSQILNLKSKILNLGLSDSVIIEDWANKPTLYSYYKTADLFLNTSLFEGYGMTLVEARAAGTKVVSTDVGVSRETGAIIAGSDKSSIAQVVVDALV